MKNPHPSSRLAIKAKKTRYFFVENIANVQRVSGKRPDAVEFIACIMSHRLLVLYNLLRNLLYRMKLIEEQTTSKEWNQSVH